MRHWGRRGRILPGNFRLVFNQIWECFEGSVFLKSWASSGRFVLRFRALGYILSKLSTSFAFEHLFSFLSFLRRYIRGKVKPEQDMTSQSINVIVQHSNIRSDCNDSSHSWNSMLNIPTYMMWSRGTSLRHYNHHPLGGSMLILNFKHPLRCHTLIKRIGSTRLSCPDVSDPPMKFDQITPN